MELGTVHVFPMKSSVQLQVWLPFLTSQVPLFLQGFGLHKLVILQIDPKMKGKKRKDLYQWNFFVRMIAVSRNK